MLRYIVGGLIATLFLVFTAPALANDGPPPMVTICHVAGLASDPANYITLTLSEEAVYGPGGHFDEGGTPQAGHEQDTFGECNPPPPPFDQCPDIPGNQPEGTDCTPPPPDDVCPNIPGNQETVPPGFGLVEGECVPVDINPQCAPPQLFNPLTGLCEGGSTPPTVPCVYTGAGKDGAVDAFGGQNNDCAPLPPPFVPPNTPPTSITTTTVATPAPPAVVVTKPPAVKPKPKPPVRKPVAKPKPKPKPKVVAKKPKPKTLTCPTGTRKYGGKCHPIVKGSG